MQFTQASWLVLELIFNVLLNRYKTELINNVQVLVLSCEKNPHPHCVHKFDMLLYVNERCQRKALTVS